MIHIPRTKATLISTDSISKDSAFGGLHILKYQSNPKEKAEIDNLNYEFQHQTADYTPLRATLCRKGAIGGKDANVRVVAVVHPSLKLFTDIVKYDPSHPPAEDYDMLNMKSAHEKTQSDFKGQKAANKELFKAYVLEGIDDARRLYLPTISGWQSVAVFPKTVFVAFDEEDPNALYGQLYLPKSPIMQADGQTQTAALFAVAHSADAVTKGALDKVTLTLEIELNVDEQKAGQSFADRNGRGSKKNRNLVIGLNTSSPLSDLRVKAIGGTVFDGRIANGRTPGATKTATMNIVDLSALEQMLLNATVGGRFKPEVLRNFHIPHLIKYANEFLKLLHKCFADYWADPTPRKQDTYRQLYVHGWPFALKGIALAYYESRIDKLGPIVAAINSPLDASLTNDEAFKKQVETQSAVWDKTPNVTFEELSDRLSKIDWLRYRKHWIEITGAKKKDGKKKTFKLKSTGEEKVEAQAQNTAAIINAVKGKILSDTWDELTKDVDA